MTLEVVESRTTVDEKTSRQPDQAVASQRKAEQASEPGVDKSPVDVRWQREERARQILFVDDEESFLALCERRFSESDYEIKTAGSAGEALSILQQGEIDVVVSDLCMPGTNGAQLMQQVEKKYPKVIRVIVSGKFDIQDTIDVINKGHVHRYLCKPFSDKDLKLALYQSLLERERADAAERRAKERQENVKRRARELGEMVVRTKREVQGAYDEVVGMLGTLAATDANRRVAELSGLLAKKRGFQSEMVYQIEVAASLRRIATLGDRDATPAQSARLLGRLKPFVEASRIVSCNEERFDGSGLPLGLAGDEIPMGARVIGLAVDYAALRDEGLGHDEACSAIDRAAERYDPRIRKALDDLDPDEVRNIFKG